MNNMPKTKIGIVAVSRDCFPESLSVTRREALIKAYKEKLDKIIKLKHPYFIIQINAVNKGMDVFYVINRLI